MTEQLQPAQPVTEKVERLPRVGDSVWYFSYGTPGGEFPSRIERAATITEVELPDDPNSPVGLAVFNPTGMFFNRVVRRAAEPRQAGCWDWPTPE